MLIAGKDEQAILAMLREKHAEVPLIMPLFAGVAHQQRGFIMNIQQAITQAMPQLVAEKQQELLDFMEFLLEKQRQQTAESNIPQGKRRADILRRMAKRNAVSSITDPVAWQREIRQDRPLPGRE